MTRPTFQRIERSLYEGRQRLGHFAQIDEHQFEGFGPDGRCLGLFDTSDQALSAIRNASEPVGQPVRDEP